MFNGINPKTFLSTPGEWHSFVIGFFEALCPWPARTQQTQQTQQTLNSEYHYYSFGRGIGFIALLLILVGIATLFMKVVL